MGFILLIIAFISGLISAYTLSTIDGMDENTGGSAFESVLKMFGKNQLTEQKAFLLNFVKLSVLINLPYFILSLLYVYGEPVPFTLAGSLVLKMLVDFSLNSRRIKNAKNIKNAVNINQKLTKASEFWSMAVYAIHIGFIL